MDKKRLKLLFDVEITDDETYLEMQDDDPRLAYVYAPCGGGGGGGGGCGGCGGCGRNSGLNAPTQSERVINRSRAWASAIDKGLFE